MTMTDPIADLLTRIRNAAQVGKDRCDVPASQAQAGAGQDPPGGGLHPHLQGAGGGPAAARIRLYLRYSSDGEPAIHGLRARLPARPARLPRRRGAAQGPRRHRRRRDLDLQGAHDRRQGARAAPRRRGHVPGLVGRLPCHASERTPSRSRRGSQVHVGGRGGPGQGAEGRAAAARPRRHQRRRRGRAGRGEPRRRRAAAVRALPRPHPRAARQRRHAASPPASSASSTSSASATRPSSRARASSCCRSASPTRWLTRRREGVAITLRREGQPADDRGHRQAEGRPGGGRDPQRCARPTPYKGKGVKYSDEVLKLKAGKTGA